MYFMQTFISRDGIRKTSIPTISLQSYIPLGGYIASLSVLGYRCQIVTNCINYPLIKMKPPNLVRNGRKCNKPFYRPLCNSLLQRQSKT